MDICVRCSNAGVTMFRNGMPDCFCIGCKNLNRSQAFTPGRLYVIIGRNIILPSGTVVRLLKERWPDNGGCFNFEVQIVRSGETTDLHSSWLFDIRKEIKEV